KPRLSITGDMVALLEIRELGRPDVLRYNPINWLNSTGGTEVSFVTVIDTLEEAKAISAFYSEIDSILKDSTATAANTPNEAAEMNQFNALRARFEELPNYRLYRSLQYSRAWRFLAKHGA